MINDSQSVNDILNKVNSKSSQKSQKQPLNYHKKKGFKQNFQLFGTIAIIFQQIILGFTFIYLVSQKVIYRIPIECQLIYNHPICRIISSSLFTIIFLRIIRNIFKLYKQRKTNNQRQILFFCFLFNCDITIQTYRYYLGIKIYTVLLFFSQFLLENYLAITIPQFWVNQLHQNAVIYFGVAMLMQLIICDLIYEFFIIYGGKYQYGQIKKNYINISRKIILQALFCKVKIFQYGWEFIQLTRKNYLIYTRQKGIPLLF